MGGRTVGSGTRSLVAVAALVALLGGCDVAENPRLLANDTVLDLTTLPTRDWGCGTGFTVGTTDGTVRLSLWADDVAPTEGTVVVDGTTWRGELVRGHDLFSQWCDDVIGPDEPEPVEEVRFEVTGTLTWSAPETGECGAIATGRLTDGTVLFEGGSLPLPDLELVNDSFGCLAG